MQHAGMAVPIKDSMSASKSGKVEAQLLFVYKSCSTIKLAAGAVLTCWGHGTREAVVVWGPLTIEQSDLG